MRKRLAAFASANDMQKKLRVWGKPWARNQRTNGDEPMRLGA